MGESRHRRTSPKDNLEIPNSPIKRKHDKDDNESDSKKQRLEEIPQTGEGYCEFSEFKISEAIQQLLNQNGITKLFPIQSLTYNKISNGKDIIGRAMTGQGKTLAFVLPLMEKVRRSSNKPKEPTILVLTPTRELAKQISHDFEMYGPHLKTLTVYGGTEYYGQERDLRNGVDVIVGTPGRILDHMEKGNLVITNLQYLILDEADRMLDMGFQDDMDKVFHNIDNKDKQILLFSATLPDWVHNVAQKFMKPDFEIIDLVGDKKASNSVEHLVVKCQWDQRPSLINDLISIYCRPNGRCIIFCDTKIECNDLINDSSFIHTCRPLHGDIPQATREKTLEAFQQNKFKCLVATDVAARGLHIDNIDLVVNKSPPSTNITFKADIDTYVHRSGRTGRAGYKGICVTLYTSKQEQVVQTIEHTLGNKFKRISPPQPKDIVITSAKQRIKDMKLIKKDILEIFKSSAEKCIKKYGAVEGVCRCLALLTGTTDEIKERSILGGRMDYITILFSCKEQMRTLSYAWGALRKLFSPEIVETVVGMSMLKDEKGALFDVPLKYYPNFEAEFERNYTPFSRCETLPELKELTNNNFYSNESSNRNNSFRGGRNSRGGGSSRGGQRGGSRFGGNGGRQSFGGGRSSFGGGRNGGRNGGFRSDR